MNTEIWFRGRLCRVTAQVAPAEPEAGFWTAYIEDSVIEPLDSGPAMFFCFQRDDGSQPIQYLEETIGESEQKGIDRLVYEANPEYDPWWPGFQNSHGQMDKEEY